MNAADNKRGKLPDHKPQPSGPEKAKHVPFQSIYREEFEVVEQRQGTLRFYPHTEQLPVLLRALNLEFHGALPARIARVDRRAVGFDKLVLFYEGLIFCNGINGTRSDRLRLFNLVNPDLVTKVAIVQQITEETRRGMCHRFRFYAGDDFFPEIRLSGKKLVFADHVLQRFSARVPNNVGEDLTSFLRAFYSAPLIAISVGPGRAFVTDYEDSILAFTYKESDTEFFITTCLTVNEINTLELESPPRVFNFHYGETFTPPRVRNWKPSVNMMALYSRWQKKCQLKPPEPPLQKSEWHRIGYCVKDYVIKKGHAPGSRLCFIDNIPAPCVFELCPGEVEPQYDESKSGLSACQ
jgi:hypothetical protein